MPAHERLSRLVERLVGAGVDAALVAPSADYRYLTGLAPPLPTRLTLLVVPAHGDPVLVTPSFERPASAPVEVATWSDGDDPVTLVADIVAARTAPAPRIAVSDRTWARYLLPLQDALPTAAWTGAGPLVGRLRAVKDAGEVDVLRRSAAVADRVLGRLPALRWAGRTEAALAADIGALLREEGADEVGEVIVAAGEHGAVPHHEPGRRPIRTGDAVVIDLGGVVDGYRSDVTRVGVVGAAPSGFAAVHGAVHAAYRAARDAARPGVPAGDVDGAARTSLAAAGLGDRFTHRLGHGLGLDVHEEPYLAPGAVELLEAGMVFTIEPGAYLPGRFGVRLEDAVVLGPEGPEALTRTPHDALDLSA